MTDPMTADATPAPRPNGRGGARPGAGRPKGSYDPLLKAERLLHAAIAELERARARPRHKLRKAPSSH